MNVLPYAGVINAQEYAMSTSVRDAPASIESDPILDYTSAAGAAYTLVRTRTERGKRKMHVSALNSNGAELLRLFGQLLSLLSTHYTFCPYRCTRFGSRRATVLPRAHLIQSR